MRFKKAAFVLLALLYLCGGKARAQSTTGTIRGHVNDAQGLAAARRDGQRRIAEPSGHPHGRDVGERRLRPHAAAVRHLQRDFELSGFERHDADRRPCADPGCCRSRSTGAGQR